MKTTNRKTSSQAPKKSNKKKWFFLGLGLVATGVLSFFGIQYYKKHKEENVINNDTPQIKKSSKPKTATKPKTKTNTTNKAKEPIKTTTAKSKAFPLKKGSRGQEVKNLQVAIIKKHGKAALPKGGADGIFGSEVEKALKTKYKHPTINGQVLVTEMTYNKIVFPNRFDPERAALLLRTYIVGNDFDKSLAQIKALSNKAVYSSVNTFFQASKSLGINQNLADALFTRFVKPLQKLALQTEFIRIGLKQNGTNWSLSGAEDKPLLITTGATNVWKDSKTSVPVPANMVLGKEVARRGDHTMFENGKEFFLVESKLVNYYKP